MKKHRSLALIAVLLAITALAAVWRLNSQPTPDPGAIVVSHNDRNAILHASSLPLSHIQGTLVDGKGKTRDIDADGIRLSALLEMVGVDSFDSLEVVALDEYRARLTPDDLSNASLILESDGSFRLVVFGDPNSKRSVSNAVRIEVQ